MSLTCPHCHKPFTLVAAAAAAPATTAAPAPVVPPPAAGVAQLTWFCPIHRKAKIVPAGVSQKTGKEYPAFWACPERGCNEKPPRGYPVPGAQVAGVPPVAPTDEPPLPPPPPPSDLEELPF